MRKLFPKSYSKVDEDDHDSTGAKEDRSKSSKCENHAHEHKILDRIRGIPSKVKIS